MSKLLVTLLTGLVATSVFAADATKGPAPTAPTAQATAPSVSAKPDSKPAKKTVVKSKKMAKKHKKSVKAG